MFYEPRRRNHGLGHDPLKAIVAPRPIGWISSISKAGHINLAPYSFFNLLAERPTIVGFSSLGMKDSAANAIETGEFVCNIVTKRDGPAMNITSSHVPPDVNEFDLAGLDMEMSSLVRPPRVKGIAAALECKFTETVQLRGVDGQTGSYFMVLGEVVGVYVDDRFIKNGQIDQGAMQALARLGYMDYAAVEAVITMERPA